MASLNSVLSVLNVGRRVRADGMRLRPGRNIIRGISGRAYDFEAHPAASLGELDGVAAVYIYARDVSSTEAHSQRLDATEADCRFGYIAEASDIAEAHRSNLHAGHFRGLGYDTALLVCIENPIIRAEIVEDILSLHRPVLNDLLRSQNGRLRG
ncbi:MAG: hypothetical protein NW223_06875 [Hyphomicrobiaceae bacterium]|nr:hypothetical protein [Hyphomicrobiaceae bacterium]